MFLELLLCTHVHDCNRRTRNLHLMMMLMMMMWMMMMMMMIMMTKAAARHCTALQWTAKNKLLEVDAARVSAPTTAPEKTRNLERGAVSLRRLSFSVRDPVHGRLPCQVPGLSREHKRKTDERVGGWSSRLVTAAARPPRSSNFLFSVVDHVSTVHKWSTRSEFSRKNRKLYCTPKALFKCTRVRLRDPDHAPILAAVYRHYLQWSICEPSLKCPECAV